MNRDPCVRFLCLTAVLMCVSVSGCSPENTTVRFVMPCDFHGLIAVTLDPDSENAPSQTETTYTYVIPDSGDLTVNDISPLARWHTTLAEYEDGRELPVEGSAPIAFRALYSIVGGDRDVHYFMVGTMSEFDEYWTQEFRSKLATENSASE